MSYFKRQLSPVFALLAFLFCTGLSLHAQDWNEYWILNDGLSETTWQTNVTNTPHFLVVQPDASICDVSLELVGGTLKVTMTPEPGVVGTTEFVVEYWIGLYASHPTTRSFRVHVVDSYVNLKEDYFTVEEGSSANTLDVLANDVGVPNNSLTITELPIVNNGSASIAVNELLFTPDSGFNGMAYLSYVACDSTGACDRTNVNICVLPDGPIAANDTIYVSTHTNKPVVAYLPAEGFTISSSPANGTAVALSSDAWKYSPANGFDGADNFILTRDSTLRRMVWIDVYPKPEPNKHAFDDVYYTRLNESITFDVLANDFKKYPIEEYTNPERGTLTWDTLGQFTYVPEPDYKGVVEFQYTTCFWVSYCETATVTIYVGDLVPQNIERYDLITHLNTPFVVNYDIPLQDFNFTVQQSPNYGSLDFHPGITTQLIGCDTITGSNLLVYTPNTDFQGDDAFEFYYCVDGSGDCHLIKADMRVQDLNLPPCECVDRCVWPGDLNNSGRVDMGDLMALGWNLGETGEPRNYPDNTLWFGQYAQDWPGILRSSPSGTNVKYADANGDGTVTDLDLGQIADHYLLKHTLIPEDNNLKADYQIEIVPQFTSVDSGDLAVFEILIGSANAPALELHGLSFSFNVPPALVDSASLSIDFHDNCWLAASSPTLELEVKPWDGRIDAGLTRVGDLTASGIGAVSTLSFIVDDDIEGIRDDDGKIPITVQLVEAVATDGAGRSIGLPAASSTIWLDAGANIDVPIDDRLLVFPNPATDLLRMHINGDDPISAVQVFSLMGIQVMQAEIAAKHAELNINHLTQGLYLLRVETESGAVIGRKFEKMIR